MMRYGPLVIFLAVCGLLLAQLLQPNEASHADDTSWPITQPVPRMLLPLLPKNATAPTMASMPLGFAQAGIGQKGGYVLNFFASWCGPCASEMPLIEQLTKEHGLVVVGVAWKDQPSSLASFFSKYGRSYSQILLDDDGKAMTELGATGVPETYVVDGGGYIRKRYRGNLSAENVKEIADFLKTATPLHPQPEAVQ